MVYALLFVILVPSFFFFCVCVCVMLNVGNFIVKATSANFIFTIDKTKKSKTLKSFVFNVYQGSQPKYQPTNFLMVSSN